MKKKLGEETIAARVIPIARRVQRSHPASEPISLLVAATAILFAAGFTDPKDMHVVRAAERLRERLRVAENPPARETATIVLAPTTIAELEEIAPRWKRAREWMWEEMRAKHQAAVFRMWIEPVMLCGRTAKTIVLGGQPSVTAWTRQRYSSYILQAFNETGTPAEAISWLDGLPGNLAPELAAPDVVGDDADQREHDQGGAA